MVKNITKLFLLPALAAMAIAPAVGQTPVNRKLFPDFTEKLNADKSLLAPVTKTREARPDHVNNAETKYFPAVFNQSGGSCGSASRIAYMFTYEINCLRDKDASLMENKYPTHFTWLLTNNGSSKDGMAIANGVPNSEVYGGFPYSRLFGAQGQDCSNTDYGWMQGYDKWYSAMFNRLERTANFPLSVETEEGREAVKNWLWNHNGDPNYPGGGVCGIGLAITGSKTLPVPSTPVNNAITPKASNNYMSVWGPQVDHAMTIVGYDDRIEFDLDGNGVYGEKEKDEVGAWIIANSWGPGYCGTGFVYCPYKYAVTHSKDGVNSTNYYSPEIYYIRRDYRPLRTLKILMEYSRRSELRLSAGISEDLNATSPEKTIQFEHFKYAGDGSNSEAAPEVPMLGRWAEGLNYDPMEFGYDLTDLSSSFDTRKDLKYFFIIESKSNAAGEGKVHSCSLIDYEFDREGIETAFPTGTEGVTIQNKGKKTIISVVVKGEPFYAPNNVSLAADGTMTWDAPVASPYTLVGYNVYINGSFSKRVDAGTTSCATDAADFGGREIAAIYNFEGEEIVSNKVSASRSGAFYGNTPGAQNYVRSMSNSGLLIKDIFRERYNQMTMEFWLNPNSCSNWNQQIGPGWGKFLMHTTNTGQLVVGWDTSNRINSSANVLRTGTWQHVAVVVDGGKMTAYVNGKNVGEIATGYTGVGGFGDLSFGQAGSNGINGKVDELRIWNVARSQREIQGMMYTEVDNPAQTPGLLFEAKMGELSSEEPLDATGHYAIQKLGTTHSRSSANTLFNDKRVLKAGISVPDETVYTGSAVKLGNASSGNAIRYEWTQSDEPEKVSSMEEPVFVFNTPGEKTVKLTVYNSKGASASAEETFEVTAMPAPEVSFTAPDVITVDQRVSFTNTTTNASGCAFEWTLEGAEKETATSTNVATVYKKAGTFTVTLKATNSSGTYTCSKTIKVGNLPPVVNFNANPAIILKGETATMIDATTHQPTSYYWTISDESHHYVFNTANPSMKFDDPGVYDVTLAVKNSIGESSLTRQKALTVCNADGENGLNFTGRETVTFDSPVDLTVSDAITIDWWMYARSNRNNSHHIGGENKNINIYTDAEGTLFVYLGNRYFNTDPGFVSVGEWHHYAVVLGKEADSRLHCYIYKDAKLVSTAERTTGWPTNMPTTLTLGGTSAPMNGVIDELRIWNSALTQEQLHQFANSPITDVAAAEKEHHLALYYDFNQSGGDVKDATSGNHTGVRTDFGPDGDAWPTTLGIFSLSNTTREDLTATYLTNYKAPFLSVEKEYTSEGSTRYLALLQDDETSRWITENSVVFNTTTTGVSVDTRKDDMMVFATKYADFEAQIDNFKIYQTVTLPAGHYVFGVDNPDVINGVDNYIVVAKGQGLPDLKDMKKTAIANAHINTRYADFAVYQDTEVSLGLLINQRGQNAQHVSRFYLEKKITNDDFTWTGIVPVGGESSVEVSAGKGMITLSSLKPAAASVYTLSGICVYRDVVRGKADVTVPAGVYIVNGQKYIVR